MRDPSTANAEKALRSVWSFTALAKAWLCGRQGMHVVLHPETTMFLRREELLEHGKDSFLFVGCPVVEDDTAPAGKVRLVFNHDGFDLPVELAKTEAPRHNPQGGFCFAEAACQECAWRWEPPESTPWDDGWQTANWLAQQHRARTGHAVNAKIVVKWIGSIAKEE